MKAFFSLLNILIFDKSTLKFAFGVTLGMAFSVAVVLSTIGLMDGYSQTLKSSLRISEGHISLSSRNGFFYRKEVSKSFKGQDVITSGLILTEAFLVYEGESIGVSLKGIEPQSFSEVTGLKTQPQAGEVWLGSELAKKFKLKKGDSIVLMLASGNKTIDGLPLLKRYQVGGVVHHGIYEKDLRFLYTHIDEVKSLLNADESINLLLMSLKNTSGELDQRIENLVWKLEDNLGYDYVVKPYWMNYRSLLEAVEVEKINISLILQIIVLVSMFNLLAFVIYLTKSKSQQIFLFEALGLTKKNLFLVWLIVLTGLWGGSCVGSLFFVELFHFLLGELSFFKLPQDVYVFSDLTISLALNDYLLVFSVTLIWLVLVSIFLGRAIFKSQAIQGLRREFQ